MHETEPTISRAGALSPGTAPTEAAPLAGLWRQVEVQEVEAAASPYPERLRMRAHVRLGALVPADVRVELAAPGLELADVQPRHRLWSVCSYGNGTYLYQADVPRALLRAPGAELRVQPSTQLADRVGDAAVVRPVDPATLALPE